MNKTLIYTLLPVIGVCLASCTGSGNKHKQIQKSDNFKTSVNLNSETVEIPDVLNVEEWVLGDSVLICQSLKSDTIFYALDANTFEKKHAFGKKGEAPEEYVTPHVVDITNDTIIIADNGKKQLLRIVDGKIISKSGMTAGHLINMPKPANKDGIAFLTTGKEGPFIGMLHSGLSQSDVLLSLSGIDGDISNISYDINGEMLVATSSASGKTTVFDLNNGNTLLLEDTGESEYYYSDVACGDDSFYLLSQKGIDGNSMEGVSVIEEYAYDGTPLNSYSLDFMASRLLPDKSGNRFILLSPMDESFHIVRINN